MFNLTTEQLNEMGNQAMIMNNTMQDYLQQQEQQRQQYIQEQEELRAKQEFEEQQRALREQHIREEVAMKLRIENEMRQQMQNEQNQYKNQQNFQNQNFQPNLQNQLNQQISHEQNNNQQPHFDNLHHNEPLHHNIINDNSQNNVEVLYKALKINAVVLSIHIIISVIVLGALATKVAFTFFSFSFIEIIALAFYLLMTFSGISTIITTFCVCNYPRRLAYISIGVIFHF